MSYTFTPEHRARIAAARRGTTARPETRAKIAASRRGTRLSAAQRAKISASLKARPIIGTCVYCGDPAQTLDHVIPRGRPGWDRPDNEVPCCSLCNQSKSDRTPEEWAAYLRQRIPALEALLKRMRVRSIAVESYLEATR